MATIKFAPKDAKIIKDNPSSSPYELVTLGLSDAAFAKLMAQPSTDINPEADLEFTNTKPENEIPVPVSTVETEIKAEQTDIIIPKLTGVISSPVRKTANAASPEKLSGQVMVLTPNGKRNFLGREFAQKLIKQDPKYKIIE